MNERGWKNGVYNPGFPIDQRYLERKAKEFALNKIEFPEIKGVQFRRSKNQHKPMRNVVTRVVMVGFDPFNHSGLPEHIERQVVFDFLYGLKRGTVVEWVNVAPVEDRNYFLAWTDGYKVTHNVPYPDDVVAPDTDEPFVLTPDQRKALLTVRDGLVHHKISQRAYAAGSFDHLQHRDHTQFAIKACNMPEIPMTTHYVFAFAGHLYKATPSVNGAPGTVEIYMPSADDLTPVAICLDEFGPRGPQRKPVEFGTFPERFLEQTGPDLSEIRSARLNPARDNWVKHGDPYEGRLPMPAGMTQSDLDGILNQQRDELEKKFPGTVSRMRGFVELASTMSQCGRNETMAVQFNPVSESEPEVLTPEDIQDREQAIQEASEGKLDYLLEGTQHDPKLRK
jgi:hypothetical protein